MKIMALCTVDKEKLKKQKNLSAEANHENVIPEEFSQLRRAGIVFDNCVEVDTAKVDDEYQAYVWSIEQKRYIPWGRGLWSERLCRARLVEAINKGWIKSDHFVFKIQSWIRFRTSSSGSENFVQRIISSFSIFIRHRRWRRSPSVTSICFRSI